MPTAQPSTGTTKTRGGTPIRSCPPLPPPPPPHGTPPFATSEPPEIQPKALLGPFTDVAEIKKVLGRLRNQPDCTSSVAAFNAWFVQSRESHLCGLGLVCPMFCTSLVPRCVSIGSVGDRRDVG